MSISNVSRVLCRTARQPDFATPPGAEIIGPLDHPADKAHGYVLRMASGIYTWSDGVCVRSISQTIARKVAG